MSVQAAQLTIADWSRVVKNSLARLHSDTKVNASDSWVTIKPNDVEDLLDKFALWAGSLGALHAPSKRLSLDHRLQDAPDIREQICKYLENLQEAIEDLNGIVTGDNPNQNLHEESDEDDEPRNSDDSPTDEAQMILEVIAQCTRSLFRMAVLIRQTGPQDRFKRAMQHSELAFPGSFDTEHVEQKYAKLRRHDSRWLARRLGSAIAKRRQFIKYCRDHKSRLGVDNDEISNEVDTRTELLSSKATIFKKKRYLEEKSKLEEEDDAVSLMTASTAFDSDTFQTLPRLNDLSPDGQAFECPICFTLQDFLREKSWKIHALRDLKSYVCTFPDQNCQNELFDDRNSWFEHELHYHRSRYTCSLCGEGVLSSKSDLESHITSAHALFSPDQMLMLVDAGRQVSSQLSAQDCPFCDEWAEALRSRGDPNGKLVPGKGGNIFVSTLRFKRHVATHQEQLAIFAIPKSFGKPGSVNSSDAHSVSNNMSAQASSDEDYQSSLLREPLIWPEEEQSQHPARNRIYSLEGALDEEGREVEALLTTRRRQRRDTESSESGAPLTTSKFRPTGDRSKPLPKSPSSPILFPLPDSDVSTNFGDQTSKPPAKALLSKAVAKANAAVEFDNAQDYRAARDLYSEACEILREVISRTSGEEDVRKIESILLTYRLRIKELHDLISSARNDEAFLTKPMSPASELADDEYITPSQLARRDLEESELHKMEGKQVRVVSPLRNENNEQPSNITLSMPTSFVSRAIPPPNTVKAACLACRARKLNCDGNNPCSRCRESGSECIQVASRRGYKGPSPPRDDNNEEPIKGTHSTPASSISEAIAPSNTMGQRACLACRSKHLKCDGKNPCSRCLVSDSECVYIASRRGYKGPRRSRASNPNKGHISDSPPSTSGDSYPVPTVATPPNDTASIYSLISGSMPGRPPSPQPAAGRVEPRTTERQRGQSPNVYGELFNERGSLSSSPSPPPPPLPPPVFRSPTIEREVITHYRDIDYGVTRAKPDTIPEEEHPIQELIVPLKDGNSD